MPESTKYPHLSIGLLSPQSFIVAGICMYMHVYMPATKKYTFFTISTDIYSLTLSIDISVDIYLNIVSINVILHQEVKKQWGNSSFPTVNNMLPYN